MEVILCQDVPKIGKIGDVVKVKEGYGRNFLIPKKMAYLATAGNLKRIEMQKVKLIETERKQEEEALQLAEKLSKTSCNIAVEVNDLEKMYGTIAEPDIVNALQDEGFTIEKKDVVLEKPIDELGIFDVGVKLHKNVTAKVRVWVTKK
jgi:large subunit ribosomal protein L9